MALRQLESLQAHVTLAAGASLARFLHVAVLGEDGVAAAFDASSRARRCSRIWCLDRDTGRRHHSDRAWRKPPGPARPPPPGRSAPFLSAWILPEFLCRRF